MDPDDKITTTDDTVSVPARPVGSAGSVGPASAGVQEPSASSPTTPQTPLGQTPSVASDEPVAGTIPGGVETPIPSAPSSAPEPTPFGGVSQPVSPGTQTPQQPAAGAGLSEDTDEPGGAI